MKLGMTDVPNSHWLVLIEGFEPSPEIQQVNDDGVYRPLHFDQKDIIGMKCLEIVDISDSLFDITIYLISKGPSEVS